MRLSVQHRLTLLQFLPTEADLTTLRIVRELQQALSFSEAEHEALQFTHPEPGRVEWAAGADPMKDVEIGPAALGIITKTIERLDKQGKIKLSWMPVVELFTKGAETPALELHRAGGQ